MQRASRQRIVAAVVFCIVEVGLVNTAPPDRYPIDAYTMPAPMARRPLRPLPPQAAAARPMPAASRIAFATGAAPIMPEPLIPLTPCDTPANEIVAENCLPGHTDWAIAGSGASSIQGFATDISVNHGQPIAFKVQTGALAYRMDIYRMGYYGGAGARKVATIQPSVSLPQTQPACVSDLATGLVDCGNWDVSATWTVPSLATSGIYFAKLVREDLAVGAPEQSSHIYFIVRDDGDIPICCSRLRTRRGRRITHTAATVCIGQPCRPRLQGQLQPPVHYPAASPHVPVRCRALMVRFEANGYDVSYFTASTAIGPTGDPTTRCPVVGHDEHWSGAQRANVERRNAGCTRILQRQRAFWKTRGEQHRRLGTPRRTLVSYKETHDNGKSDPSPQWTGTWRDPRFSPPSDGGRPENALSGSLFVVNGGSVGSYAAMQVPPAQGRLRFWRNTGVQAQALAGQTATLPPGTLGYEWDTDPDNGWRPAGLFHLSSTTVSVGARLLDYGTIYGPGSVTHTLTMYRHSSGALVFGAGTVRWVWGLDATHDADPTPDPLAATFPASTDMQQATVNLLADMHAQPATLAPGLVPADPSDDTTPPTSLVLNPAPSASIPIGTVTISGTADDGLNHVAGVEVSVDGGASWHAATGRESWTYQWTPSVPGPAVITSRAADESGNIETPGAGITVTVTPAGANCPCRIWDSSVIPTAVSVEDPGQVEVGVRFHSQVG